MRESYPGQLRTRTQIRLLVAVAVVGSAFLGGTAYGQHHPAVTGQLSGTGGTGDSVPPPGEIVCSLPGNECLRIQLDNPDYEVLTPKPAPAVTPASLSR